MFGVGELLPGSAFFLPKRIVGIAAGLDEGEEFPVGNEVAAGLEGCGRRFVGAEFVVPAVDLWGAAVAAKAKLGGGDVDQGVGGGLPGSWCR